MAALSFCNWFERVIRAILNADMLFRALGAFGLGIAFLIVSPSLRDTVMDLISAAAAYVQDNGPASYCVLALAGLGAAMAWIHHASHAG